MSNKKKLFAVHVALIFGAALMVGPFIWMILTAFKTVGEATAVPPILLPSSWKLENFKEALNLAPFVSFYKNTILMTIGRVLGQLVFCSLAAYALARIDFAGKNFIFMLILSVLMVPSQIFIIPQYMIMNRLGLLDTIWALFIPGMFSGFGTFLLRQFFMSLPKPLEEAARLDGCNHFQIYWKVMLPLARSGMVALSILTIIWSWNDLLWPMIANNSMKMLTLSAGLATFQGQFFTNFPVLMAGALLAIWPLLLIFVIFQCQFIEGIALSGTKG